MIRALAVIVLAAFCAVLFGVDGTLQAAQNDASRQRVIAERVAKMKVGDIVKGERADGTKFEGRLVATTPDSVTIDLYRRRAFRRVQRIGTETLALADVRDIKKPLSGTQQALIVAGIAVGACAVATSLATANLESEPDERGRRPDGAPINDDTDAAPADAPLLAAP